MYICEKCGKEVFVKFGSGRFCSRECANSHQHSEESKLKCSNSVKKYFNSIKNTPIDEKRIEKSRKILKQINDRRIKKVTYSTCCCCGKIIDITYKHKISSGRYYCNGTCRNIHLNKIKEIGGLSSGYNVSKWEKDFQKILQQYSIEYEANKRDLIPSGLEIDIWLPQYKIAIELNGIYHYSTKPYKGDIKKLEKRQLKDSIKKKECEELGYIFLVFEDRKIINTEEFFINFVEELKSGQSK